MSEAVAAPGSGAEGDIRPLVAGKASNRSVWIFAGIVGIIGVSMFSALAARREALVSPAIAPAAGTDAGMIAPPPALSIPVAPDSYAYPVVLTPPVQSAPAFAAAPPARPAPTSRSREDNSLPPIGGGTPYNPNPPMVYPPINSGYVQPASSAMPPIAGSDAEAGKDGRSHATRLSNPSTTVPQGTVIQAVLETALDSNRAGFARAIVSRDVTSFDGTRVLIPKGSKLFGEYKADLERGQNRALIQWRRLTRPDGSIIDVDSPSADPLGRAGVKGKVNSHFLARFGGTILQSALDIGVLLATRKATGDTVILTNGQPNMEGMVGRKPEDIKPTLTVKQGTSVSIFVMRDLDFTDVEP